MRCWRICRRAFRAPTGEGAERYGGRWNSRGRRLVYTASSLALAAVELFVNIDPNLLPDDLVSIVGEVPDELPLERLEEARLPRDWNKTRSPALQRIGDQWIQEGRTTGLWVPSAAVRGDWNLLLNPAHPDFARVSFEAPVAFVFDPRMFTRGGSRHDDEG